MKTMPEFLDYNEMAKSEAMPAGRALSVLIVKSKAHGDFYFNTYTKLFDSYFWSVISYCIAILGSYLCCSAQSYPVFFMGLGDAINQDIGWIPSCVKQRSCGFRHGARCNVMPTDRMNYKVYQWTFRNAINKKKNWCFRLWQNLEKVM